MRARRRDENKTTSVPRASSRASALHVLLGRVAIGVALAATAAPAPVFAKPPEAVQQFAAAQKLYDAGDYGGALPLFRKVFESSGSPNARLYVARCLRELGRLPEAFEEMDATQREAATRADSEAKYAQTRDAAAAERAILESRVGRLIVAIANPPDGVKVSVNDAPFSNDRIGSPTAVNPGPIEVVAEAPGASPIRRRITIGAGETKTVALTLGREEEEARPPPEPPALPAETSGGGVRTAGYVVAGLGVAGMALFGVAGVMSEQKYSTYTKECIEARCSDARRDELKGPGETLDKLWLAGLIGGIVGITGGTAMIVFGGPDAAPKTAKLTVAPGWATVDVTVAF